MILIIIFVVAMLLWAASLLTEIPPPWSRVAAFCAWVAVAVLFLMGHNLNAL